ncbi:hypothetical protein FBEOM_13676 [Fusarium beomiforme]|uniref:Uncharacterized protein n=1 Tax=Fusarium beomiforme TaxID=44412 RepID=A0A9P5A5D6_9HYPO|nr:hypothetical protein FBEOM_13676 [Fusarium beomiforme]
MPSQAKRTVAARRAAATQRLQRTTALAPRDVFCQHCFYSQKTALTAGMKKPAARKPTEVPLIVCEYESASSSRCAHCNEKGKVCEPVYTLLAGNALDLLQLTRYARNLTMLDDEDPPADLLDGDTIPLLLSREQRQMVVGTVLDLWEGFGSILQAHSREHNLGGINTAKKDRVEPLAAYRGHVLNRRQLLAVQNGPRPSDPAELRAWQQWSLLRLEPGDEMYPFWLVALEGFAEGISAALNEGDVFQDDWIIEQMEAIPVRVPNE